MSRIRHSRLVWELSRGSVWLLGKLWLRLRYEGRTNIPRTGAVLLVANHGSYLDPLLLGVGVPRFVAFLAQKGLAKVAPVRWWLRWMGVSLIDRNAPSKDVLRRLAECLAEGHVACVFPEGTRSRDGSIGAFRAGVELLVRRSGATVVPVGLDGLQRAFPRGAKLPRPHRCVVRYGQPWPAERVLAPGGIEALRAEVAALAHAPLRGPDTQVDNGREAQPSDPPSSTGVRA